MKGNRYIKRSLMMIICIEKKERKEIFRALTNTIWISRRRRQRCLSQNEIIWVYFYIYNKNISPGYFTFFIIIIISVFYFVFLPKFYSITMCLCLYTHSIVVVGYATRFLFFLLVYISLIASHFVFICSVFSHLTSHSL